MGDSIIDRLRHVATHQVDISDEVRAVANGALDEIERLMKEQARLLDAIKNARSVFSEAKNAIEDALFQMGGALSSVGIMCAIHQPAPPVVCDALRLACDAFDDDDDDDDDDTKGHTAKN